MTEAFLLIPEDLLSRAENRKTSGLSGFLLSGCWRSAGRQHQAAGCFRSAAGWPLAGAQKLLAKLPALAKSDAVNNCLHPPDSRQISKVL